MLIQSLGFKWRASTSFNIVHKTFKEPNVLLESKLCNSLQSATIITKYKRKRLFSILNKKTHVLGHQQRHTKISKIQKFIRKSQNNKSNENFRKFCQLNKPVVVIDHHLDSAGCNSRGVANYKGWLSVFLIRKRTIHRKCLVQYFSLAPLKVKYRLSRTRNTSIDFINRGK